MMIMRRLSMGGAVMLGLLLQVFTVTAPAVAAPNQIDPITVTAKTDTDTCLDCHGYQGFAVPPAKQVKR